MQKHITSLLFSIFFLNAFSSHACVNCLIDQVRHDMSLPQLSHCSVWGPTLVSKKDHYELEIPAPGFGKSDIKVTTEGNTLTIQGEKKKKGEKTEKQVIFGNNYQSFIYKFPLGQDIIEGSINASLKDGILSVTAKKDPKKSEKVIKVQ